MSSHLLSLNDALEDFEAGEYSLKTTVVVQIGTLATTWQLLLEASMTQDPHGNPLMVVHLRRWADDDATGIEAEEVASLTEHWQLNLPEIADALGIDPDARIFELEWAVVPSAATIARAKDGRWPNMDADEG